MNSDPIKCDECGKFVAYADLESGAAKSTYVTPDSHFSDERIEFLCRRCNVTQAPSPADLPRDADQEHLTPGPANP